MLSVKEGSLLAETSSGSGDATLASGGGSDLSAILPALLHHAPVLRHCHVANALCRGALPQTAAIISRMAANCPTASSSLIRGCMDAYLQASAALSSSSSAPSSSSETTTTPSSSSSSKTASNHTSNPMTYDNTDPPPPQGNEESKQTQDITHKHHLLIITVSTDAVSKIAKLSPREAFKVMRLLYNPSSTRQKDTMIMPEMLLRLAMEHDAMTAISMLLHACLSFPKNDDDEEEEKDASNGGASSSTDGRSKTKQGITKPSMNRNDRSLSGGGGGGNTTASSSSGGGGVSRKNRHLRRRRIRNPPKPSLSSFLSSTSSKCHSKPNNSSSGGVVAVSLKEILIKNITLATLTRKFVLDYLISILSRHDDDDDNNHNNNKSWGEATLVIRTYALLISHIGLGSGSSLGSGSTYVETVMTKLHQLVDMLTPSLQQHQQPQDSISGTLPSTSPADEFLRVALCATLVTCSNYPPIGDAKQLFMSGTASNACANCIKKLLMPQPPPPNGGGVSNENQVFVAQIAGFLSSQDAIELHLLVMHSLLRKEYNDENEDTSVVAVAVAALDDGSHTLKPGSKNSSSSITTTAYFNTCRWTTTKVLDTPHMIKLRDVGLSIPHMLTNVMAVVDAARRSQKITTTTDDDDTEEEWLHSLVKKLLNNKQNCATVFGRKGVWMLLNLAVETLVHRNKRADGTQKCVVPIVLPLSLEALGRKIKWRNTIGGGGGAEIEHGTTTAAPPLQGFELQTQFVLQLLYAAMFLEKADKSPFVIDLRTFPLLETLAFCRSYALTTNDVVVDTTDCNHRKGGEVMLYHDRLRDLIRKQCPDILNIVPPRDFAVDLFSHCLLNEHFISSHNSKDDSSSSSFIVTPNTVSNAIHVCLHRDNSNSNDNEATTRDPSGSLAESIFLHARSTLPYIDVDRAAACALLSSSSSDPHSPPPYFSYTALCRDPLVMLKCSISTWHTRGLRKIALLVLERLLEANTQIVMRMEPSRRVADEILAARDLILTRCLVIVANGEYILRGNRNKNESNSSSSNANGIHPHEPIQCSITIHMVRSIVSHRPGLITMIIKQGIPDKAVDWLVEHIPECLSDAQELTTCLSGRNPLTAAERLATADAALRIAISHGYRDESRAQPLAYAALTVLVSCFFLVIGPSGVPVNVICEEGGEDITEQCRKSTFRMLSVMQRIGGGGKQSVALKNEASMALTKIATLCKNESLQQGGVGGVGGGGIAGLAAKRKKGLLKEIWDACTRAINAIGGGSAQTGTLSQV